MTSTTSEQRWSTAGIPDDEQLPAWQDVASEAWVPVQVRREGIGALPSSVTTRALGALQLSDIVTLPQRVSRTSAQAGRGDGGLTFVNVPLVNGTSASQDGREATLGAGDFAIVDSARPFELEFRRPLRQLSVSVPSELLMPRLAAPAALTARAVRAESGLGRVTSQALRAASSARHLDRHQSRQLGEHLVGLLALALGADRPTPASGPRLLLQLALDEVERSLGEARLDPTMLADRIGISTRYLHRLFHDHGVSFGRHLLERRLARCHLDLVDPARATWTIASIAADRGLDSPSYFARAYGQRYGRTPSQRRRETSKGTSPGDLAAGPLHG